MIKRLTNTPWHCPFCAATTLCCAALSLPAQGMVGNQYEFLFSAKQGQTLGQTYLLNHDSAGIPLALDQNLVSVDAALMKRIADTLPEQKDIRTQSQNLIADDDSAVVQLVKPADVWVTFLHEGAAARNVFGYFTYPEGQPPQSAAAIDHIIILPNASYSTAGGSKLGMKTGHRIYLGQFPAATRIGFFVVANGWHSTLGVNPDTQRYPVFYSLSTLNPEDTAELRKHMVLLKDSWGQRLVLGMEDLRRSGGDHDFNDVIFAVESNPIDAIKTEEIIELNYVKGSDLDQDGIPDTLDDYPEDPLLTTRVTYPNDKGRAQLAFEDLWPLEGDYDLNDLVLAYTLDEGRNAAGEIREIEGHFQVKARGSAYSHGFGIHFPQLKPDALESASVWVDSQPSVPLVSEPGQTSLTLILTEDTKKIASKNATTRTCYTTKFNADRNCAADQGPTIHFKARFKQALTRQELGSAPYNPFIYIVGDRLRETHLPNHPPTAKHKSWLFGWSNEGSDPKAGRYYKTKDRGLPWAVNLPDEWQQPLEKQQVHFCYPGFVDWVNTSGAKALDWYKTPVADCVFPTK
jgi:LruC domain-containing protein